MKRIIIILALALLASPAFQAQCPQLYNYLGNPSSTPYWYQCNGVDYTLSLQSPTDIGPWTVDWGDGSPVESGASLISPASITHLYPSTVDTFVVTLNETSTGCIVQGIVVMEEATSASIQIPVGGLTQACAPQDMEFTNSSTNTSETTVFVWDFGDGSPNETYDYTNWNQTITHTYQENTVDCETVVTLTAENYCNTIQGGNSTATFNPIRIWDYDDAAITPSDYVLCWPENTVSYTNTTEMNCYMQGNIAQRYEFWNFGDYWGLGYDSIIPWTPWPPTFPQTMSYPGVGTYTTMLLDSNFCGVDTAFISITIVPPPTAGLTASDDTICAGESIDFFNGSSPEANAWLIDFGTGGGWQYMGAIGTTHTYNTPGDFNVGLIAYVSGAGTSCSDTTWIDIHVQPGPNAAFSLSDDAACDELTYSVTDNSLGAVIWSWDMGNGNTYAIPTPPDQTYTSSGSYTVELEIEAANGCTDYTSQEVNVFTEPIADFTTLNVCLGDTAIFIDQSVADTSDPLVTWLWDFGDGNTFSGQQGENLYLAGGLYDVQLQVATANCFDDTLIQISVDAPPSVGFTSDVSGGCGPLIVEFTNTSVGATSYEWNFGDGTATSNDTSTVHVFNNPSSNDTIYEVVLSAFNAFGCAARDTMEISVFGNATAAFSSNATPGCAPYVADFTNLSSGAESYQWNFGDGTPTSTDVDVSHLFDNTTPFIQYYDVQLIAFDSNGCNDTTYQSVTSYPEPDFTFDVSGSSGCAPLTVEFPTLAGAVSYQWDFGDGYTANGPGPVHTYQNAGTTTIQYTVQLIGSNAFGCTDTAYSYVDVYPLPFAQFTANPTSGCSPLTVSFENQSILADQNMWVYGDGDTLITSDVNHDHIFINNGPSAVNRNIRLIVTSADGCTSVANHSVTVYPEVSAGFSSISEGCSPLSVDFSDSSVGADSYNWQFGDGGIAVVPEPNHVYMNNTAATQSREVRLVVSNSYGCSDTTYSNIDVFPEPVAQFMASPISGCSPLTIQFEDQSLLAEQSLWTFGTNDSLVGPVSQHEYTYTNTGSSQVNYTTILSVTSSEGCTSTDNQTFTVYPEVHANFNSLEEGCSPLSVDFVNNSLGAASYQWQFGDGGLSYDDNPNHVYVNSSTDTETHEVLLIAMNNYGCADTATSNITVHARPIAQFMASPTTGCSPLAVEFENISVLADTSIWTFGNGDTLISNVLIHEYVYLNSTAAPLSFTASLQVITKEGCTSSFSTPINVYPDVEADFSMNEEGCSPLTVQFENQSTGATNYSWSFGDGFMDVSTSPEHVFYNTALYDTSYVVTLSASSAYGCSDTEQDTVTVFSLPIAEFDLSGTEGCSPFEVFITDNSQGATNYTWTYGNGAQSDTTVSLHAFTYVNQNNGVQNFDLVLEVETDHGCTDQTETEITVFPEVTAQFESDPALCAGEAFTFFNQTIGAESYQWIFGDGGSSVSTNPIHSYQNNSGGTQEFEVSLVATSQYACTDQYIDIIEVYTAPIANISIDSSSVCYPLYVEFGNQSLYATDFEWDYGDGSSSMNSDPLHSHVFTNTTSNLITYEISMIASTVEQCTDTAYLEVQVIPDLEASFEEVEDGCHPLEVDFSNESDGALEYIWDFGDGQVDTIYEPIHTFDNYGITDEQFTITLVASSYFGCTDSVTQTITVFPLPDAEFSVDPVVQVYPDATIQIEDYSVAGTATYEWFLGDGTESNDPGLNSHTYSTWGTYEVALNIDNGHCSDLSIQVVEIQAPPPIVDFAGGGEGCAPITIEFENYSEYGTSYLWNFGDGGVSANEEPVYTYYVPGTYTVSLLVSGPGGSEIVVHDTVVKVRPNANAYFTANPNVINTGDVVFFYNLSNQADLFEWDFGDGGTSNEEDPTHIYQETGSFPVTLIADNQYNCPDTFRLDDAVLVDVGGYIDFPNAFTPSSTGGTDGIYDPTQLDNDVFYPVFAGVEEYKLQIFNRWGELLYESNEVNRGWDGFYRGEPAQQGVYVWRAQVTFTDGKQVIKAGDLTLLR